MSSQESEPEAALGRHDPFADANTMDEAAAKEWVRLLDGRSAAPDQLALRQKLVELLALARGDQVVEVGCGTGALLVDLARAVGPSGRVIGVEPQERFVRAARDRLAREGVAAWSEARVGRAESLDLHGNTVNACVAQTVLIHLPPSTLNRALSEMVRVTRVGGRVASADQDADSWAIDHPDRELTRTIVRFNSDERYADGWTGRRLRRMLLDAGLEQVRVSPIAHVDTEADSYLYRMAERIAVAAADARAIGREECARWLGQLRDLVARGRFFSSISLYICVGVRAG
jgi:ubiquinone/menaquinone biosynthesis C-methylase UbiE